ncbi:hypothetical protein P12x_002980 [Tundrisphaera lichenicola]|uniref:hypothetical protein n=1 Tax=Tundrisphaera lichenicola TaxID=2029860 RepID=UPI003EBC1421
MEDEPVHLVLSQDEALVLFELLSRYDETERFGVDDPAEVLSLWHLHGVLQKKLVAPLQADYADQPRRARDRLREKDGYV